MTEHPTSGQTGAAPIRVLVVDDQAIVRDGLVTVLSLLPDIEVVGEATNGDEACRLAAELHPDVVLMDLRMPVTDGAGSGGTMTNGAVTHGAVTDGAVTDGAVPAGAEAEGVLATRRIVAESAGTAILVLTTFADDASILGALRAGARGYLTKDAGRAEVAAAIRAVAHGQTTLAPGIGDRVIGGLTSHQVASRDQAQTGPRGIAARFGLTQRESEVLVLVGNGLNNTEIASALFVGVPTVKTHINAIFAKLGVRDRAKAIAMVRG
jgi:DNA-binding NarL/FixJ family response regulator